MIAARHFVYYLLATQLPVEGARPTNDNVQSAEMRPGGAMVRDVHGSLKADVSEGADELSRAGAEASELQRLLSLEKEQREAEHAAQGKDLSSTQDNALLQEKHASNGLESKSKAQAAVKKDAEGQSAEHIKSKSSDANGELKRLEEKSKASSGEKSEEKQKSTTGEKSKGLEDQKHSKVKSDIKVEHAARKASSGKALKGNTKHSKGLKLLSKRGSSLGQERATPKPPPKPQEADAEDSFDNEFDNEDAAVQGMMADVEESDEADVGGGGAMPPGASDGGGEGGDRFGGEIFADIDDGALARKDLFKNTEDRVGQLKTAMTGIDQVKQKVERAIDQVDSKSNAYEESINELSANFARLHEEASNVHTDLLTELKNRESKRMCALENVDRILKGQAMRPCNGYRPPSMMNRMDVDSNAEDDDQQSTPTPSKAKEQDSDGQ